MRSPRLLAKSIVFTVIVAVHFNLICSSGVAGPNSANSSQPSRIQADFLTLQQQARQLAENIALLEWIWAYDEDTISTIGEDQWLDFINSVYDTLDELQSQ